MSNVLEIKVDGGRVLGEWPTPLCPWTRQKLVERLTRLAEGIHPRDPDIAVGLAHAIHLITWGTLLPGGPDGPHAFGVLDDADMVGQPSPPPIPEAPETEPDLAMTCDEGEEPLEAG
jgi:hypothetical protein